MFRKHHIQKSLLVAIAILALGMISILAASQGTTSNEASSASSGLSVLIKPFVVTIGMEGLGQQVKNFLESAIVFSGYSVVQTEEKVDYVLTGEISKTQDAFLIKYTINDQKMPGEYAQGEEELLLKLTRLVSGLNRYAKSDWADFRRKRHEIRRLELMPDINSTLDTDQMVAVAGGEFVMGSSRGNEDERPIHKEKVGNFQMDKYEVVCEDYIGFLNEMGAQLHDIRSWFTYDGYSLVELQKDNTWRTKKGYDKYPMTNVSWYGAVAYCGNKGKRLPTEIEWEYVARGGAASEYFWGDEWTAFKSNNLQYTGDLDKLRAAVGDWDPSQATLLPVGRFEANAFGVYDLLGNAWEWTKDFYSVYPYSDYTINSNKPRYTYDNTLRVLRGGSFSSYGNNQRVAVRLPSNPGTKNPLRGFRCAKDE